MEPGPAMKAQRKGHLGRQEAGRGRKEPPGAFRECGPAHTLIYAQGNPS